jgi:hypothetical protein
MMSKSTAHEVYTTTSAQHPQLPASSLPTFISRIREYIHTQHTQHDGPTTGYIQPRKGGGVKGGVVRSRKDAVTRLGVETRRMLLPGGAQAALRRSWGVKFGELAVFSEVPLSTPGLSTLETTTFTSSNANKSSTTAVSTKTGSRGATEGDVDVDRMKDLRLVPVPPVCMHVYFLCVCV